MRAESPSGGASLGLPNADERSPGVGCGEMESPGMAHTEPLKRIRDQHGLQSRLTEKGKLGSGEESGGGRSGGVCGRFITLKAGASRRGMGRPAAAIARPGLDGANSIHCAQTVFQRKNWLHEKQRDDRETPEHGYVIIVVCSTNCQQPT